MLLSLFEENAFAGKGCRFLRGLRDKHCDLQKRSFRLILILLCLSIMFSASIYNFVFDCGMRGIIKVEGSF